MMYSKAEFAALIDAFVSANEEGIRTISDAVFYFAEPAMQEHETAKYLGAILEREGFQVDRGISGMPTAFMATFGTGKPILAIHTEFDAIPGNSQKSGDDVQQAEIVPGAPGHCEGHNVNAAVLVAAAVSIKRAMERFGIEGTLRVFGAPGEELLLPRPWFVRDGYFDEVEAAFHPHIWHDFHSDQGLLQYALISARFRFAGEAAHSAVNPWKGRSALNAAVLFDVGMAQQREHFMPETLVHRVMTEGGVQPNVIAESAEAWWFFRSSTAGGVRLAFDTAKRVAKGAAMMADTKVAVTVDSAVWPVLSNPVLAGLVQRNVELTGMPAWTEAEQALAKRIQRAAGAEEKGLAVRPLPLPAANGPLTGSNDSGDVSWKVPMVRLWYPGSVPGVIFHQWTAGVGLATSIAHKGACAGAKALAVSILETFTDASLRARAQEAHRLATGTVNYAPLLDDVERPSPDTNRAVMEKYRSAQAQFYRPAIPAFVG